MAATSLARFPADLLLLILSHCSLTDILSFSAVCQSFRSLSQARSLWITALERTRCIRPIPLPTHADLTALPLRRLRAVARQAIRLQRNLSLPEPHILGPIKCVQLDASLDLIFQIPGTDLYLFHSRASSSVVCWDIALGSSVTEPLVVGNRIIDVSPGEDLPGKFSMCCLFQEINHQTATISEYLTILRVSYDDHSNVQVDITFKHEFMGSYLRWAVFMNSEIVGVLCVPHTLPDPCISVVAFNRYTHKGVVVMTDILYDELVTNGHSGSSSFGNDIFVLIEYEDLSYRYRCPASHLPYSANTDCPPHTTLKLGAVPRISWGSILPGHLHYKQFGPLSADPAYGVPAVSLHRIRAWVLGQVREEGDEGEMGIGVGQPYMHIRFWTRSDREQGFASTPPNIVPACFINVPGYLWSSASLTWQLMLLPHSGRQVLLVVKDEEEIKLLLVRFCTEEKVATVHRLNVPSFIGMDHVYGLSLDDHRGVVTLLDTRGVLFAIPYA